MELSDLASDTSTDDEDEDSNREHLQLEYLALSSDELQLLLAFLGCELYCPWRAAWRALAATSLQNHLQLNTAIHAHRDERSSECAGPPWRVRSPPGT